MTEPPLPLIITPTGDGFAVVGEIDAHSAPAITAALAHLPGDTITLDLSARALRSRAPEDHAVSRSRSPTSRGSRALYVAAGYVAAQLAGGMAGLLVAAWLLGGRLGHPAVNYVVTAPGTGGVWVAFAAEAVISFLMMTTVLELSSRARVARFTGLAAGGLVALFITVEAPLSGMSMNVARSLPSNLLAARASTLWIYAAAPLLGMWLAAARYVLWHRSRHGHGHVGCAKLHHSPRVRCIFCGDWHD